MSSSGFMYREKYKFHKKKRIKENDRQTHKIKILHAHEDFPNNNEI